MRSLSLLFFTRIIFILAFFIPSYSYAHSGGRDANGGHAKRTTGEYHCHQSDCITPTVIGPEAAHIDVMSFNIQFLSYFKKRNNEALAALVAPYDVVVIQELVTPPFEGCFPDGTDYKPDPESQQFFDTMADKGFDYILSEEDTDTNDRLHVNMHYSLLKNYRSLT